MSMMSRESTDKDVTLSEEQLRGIWAAAQVSPGSTEAPSNPSNPGPGRIQLEETPATFTMNETPGPWTLYEEDYADVGGEGRDGGFQVQATNQGGIAGAESSLPGIREDVGVEDSWFNPSAGAGPSTHPDIAQYLSSEHNYGQPSPPFQSSPGRITHSATSVQSWHNLLYQ